MTSKHSKRLTYETLVLLHKYEITQQRYFSEKNQLLLMLDAHGQRAYSNDDMNRLILRQWSKKIVTAVLTHHDTLIKWGFSVDHILTLACRRGGADSILAVVNTLSHLKDNQGHQLPISTLHPQLTAEHITHLGSRPNGAVKLKSLIKALNQLNEIQPNDVSLASRDPDLTLMHILNIIYKYPHKTLDLITQLLKQQHTIINLIKITEMKSGYNKLKSLILHTAQLQQSGYSPKAIEFMILNENETTYQPQEVLAEFKSIPEPEEPNLNSCEPCLSDDSWEAIWDEVEHELFDHAVEVTVQTEAPSLVSCGTSRHRLWSVMGSEKAHDDSSDDYHTESFKRQKI